MLSQIKYKLEQFLLDFNRRYDGIKVMYLVILLLLSTVLILIMVDDKPNKTYNSDISQMIQDIETINMDLESINQSLDNIIETLNKRDISK